MREVYIGATLANALNDTWGEEKKKKRKLGRALVLRVSTG